MRQKMVNKKIEKITRIEEMNWKQIDVLNRNTTIFFLPISPLEEHGPHLPVGTDVFITEAVAKEAMKSLKKKKKNVFPVLLPTLFLGYSGLTQGFPGTFSVDARAIEDVIFGITYSLGKHGFRYMLLCTYHMDPFYLKAIHKGLNKAMSKSPIRVSEPISSYFYRRKKGEKKDIHAGAEETSIMCYLYPYLVDESYKTLHSYQLISFSLRDYRKTFKELGAVNGYIGEPGEASIDHGKKLFTELVELYVNAAIDLYSGKSPPSIPKTIKWLPFFMQRK